MPTTVTPLTKEQATQLFEGLKVKNRMPPEVWEKLEKQGWYIPDDYSIEKKYKGYFIVIEFCIGDFCVYPCSKNGHYLLEKKSQNIHFLEALVAAVMLESRIDAGEHWTGEED